MRRGRGLWLELCSVSDVNYDDEDDVEDQDDSYGWNGANQAAAMSSLA